jgi:predicted transglutaminase-like cysteine proteinase
LSFLLALSGFFTIGLQGASTLPERVNLAHALYCIEYREECPGTGPAVIKWSRRVERDIRATDARVNQVIIPRNEKVDSWIVNPRYGDCDDFVVTKRHDLIKLGYPPRALRPKVVSRNKRNDHLVLEVVTTKRIYVLDMDVHGAGGLRQRQTVSGRVRSTSVGAHLRNLIYELSISSAR